MYSTLFTILPLPIAFLGMIFATDSPHHSPFFPISILLVIDGIPLAFLLVSYFQYIKKAMNK